MHAKTIIGFGYRIILYQELSRSRFVLSALTDNSHNTNQHSLDNSQYYAQPHPIIVNYHMESLEDLHVCCHGIHPCTCTVSSDFTTYTNQKTNKIY